RGDSRADRPDPRAGPANRPDRSRPAPIQPRRKRLLARPGGGVPLHDAVGEAILLVQLGRGAKQISCENRRLPALAVEGNRPQLVQVLVNLLTNACDASHPGDRVLVDAKVLDGGRMAVTVADQGAGMSEAVRHRIFEPFFTTKEIGQGTGLGLPLAYSIVREHGGRMDVQSSPGAGTMVVVELPLHQSPPLVSTSDSEFPRAEA